MPSWGRNTPWRQGNALSDDAAKAAGLPAEPIGEVVAIVVSHNCDLAQTPSLEPDVEVIVGQKIPRADGNFTCAKNARRLHLTFSGSTEHLIVDLIAGRKIPIAKDLLVGYDPVPTLRLTSAEHAILQRWLAARYRRPAFSDEFDARLKRTGLLDEFRKIMKSSGAFIAAIFFDLDQGEEISRSGPDDLYALAIYLLFDTGIDPVVAEQEAETAKIAIKKAFRDKCLSKENGTWHDIELIECEIISDEAMTVRQAESLKRWSADHISLRPEQPQAILRDE
jgi:hypothetical protein